MRNKRTTPETKVVEDDFEKFVERLNLKEFTEKKDEWEKFYGT